VPMHDLERQTGFDAAEPVSASTVSGFLTQRLQKIPAAGDQWLENGYQFTVSRIKDARIDEVEITVPNSASTAPVDPAAD
jgi:CBS domain containing-hemolysin-like protein